MHRSSPTTGHHPNHRQIHSLLHPQHSSPSSATTPVATLAASTRILRQPSPTPLSCGLSHPCLCATAALPPLLAQVVATLTWPAIPIPPVPATPQRTAASFPALSYSLFLALSLSFSSVQALVHDGPHCRTSQRCQCCCHPPTPPSPVDALSAHTRSYFPHVSPSSQFLLSHSPFWFSKSPAASTQQRDHHIRTLVTPHPRQPGHPCSASPQLTAPQ